MHDLPHELQALLAGGTWQTIASGFSGAQVFRIVCPDAPACYLKMAVSPFQEELLAEKERLEWLQGRLPVPEIIAFSTERKSSSHTGIIVYPIS